MCVENIPHNVEKYSTTGEFCKHPAGIIQPEVPVIKNSI